MSEDEIIAMWDEFDAIMQQYGYSISVHNTVTTGRGTTAYKNSDKWIPTMELHVWSTGEMSIHVRNRCGSSVLNNGPTVAIYRYNGKDKNVLRHMIDYAVNKWSGYNKSNPFIFTEGEDVAERKDF